MLILRKEIGFAINQEVTDDFELPMGDFGESTAL
jgi:hypothetical protein